MRMIVAGGFLLVVFFYSINAFSQASIKDSSIAFPMIGASFQYQAPGGDMADYFNSNLNVGGFFQWKLKSNWLLGIEGEFLFSDNIKSNPILWGISTQEGQIIGQDGRYATIQMMERGFRFSMKAGKILPLFGPNLNSGLLLTAAA